MNNTLLIIGNGFDLYHGMTTGYLDFKNFVLNWDSYSKLIINHLTDENSNDIVDISKCCNFDGKVFKVIYNSGFSKGSYEYFNNKTLKKGNLYKNSFLNYFITNDYDNNLWSDIESEIEKILLVFENYFHNDIFKVKDTLHNFVNAENIHDIPMQYNIDSLDIKIINAFAPDNFRRLFNRRRRENSGDFKIEFLDKQKIENFKSEVYKKLYNDFIEFKNLFYIYIIEIANKLLNSKINNVILLQLLLKKASNVEILSFNYTFPNALGSYVKDYNESKIFHVHGSCEGFFSKEAKIVFGVNDEEFNDDASIPFQKYYQRFIYDTDNDIEYKKYQSYISFGFSFDFKDKTIINNVIQELLNHSYKSLVIFCKGHEGRIQIFNNLVKSFGKENIIKLTTGKKQISFLIIYPT